MPTTLPRHTITETSDVKTWLDEAARTWPDAQSRSDLIKRLMERGYESVAQQEEDLVERRRRAIRAASGSLPGVWPSGWYEQYKQEEW